jgi:hypothetical protein
VFGLPLAVTAQRKLNNARIGVLIQTTPEGTKHLMMAFTKRLAELGWLEGKNIEYLLRYAQGNPTQYSTLIVETLAQKPDVIYAPFGPLHSQPRSILPMSPSCFPSSTIRSAWVSLRVSLVPAGMQLASQREVAS